MRGFRLLFVLASVAALGLANFASDRDAVADLEAGQLFGGGCDTAFWSVNCSIPCSGGGYCDSGTGPFRFGSTSSICAGNSNSACGTVYGGCDNG